MSDFTETRGAAEGTVCGSAWWSPEEKQVRFCARVLPYEWRRGSAILPMMHARLQDAHRVCVALV